MEILLPQEVKEPERAHTLANGWLEGCSDREREEGGSEGGSEGVSEGGREGGTTVWRVGGKKGGREEGREGGRERREGEREVIRASKKPLDRAIT